jgi:hypothetical protein
MFLNPQGAFSCLLKGWDPKEVSEARKWGITGAASGRVGGCSTDSDQWSKVRMGLAEVKLVKESGAL